MNWDLTQIGRTITQNANALRKAVALNQTELANHTDLSRSTLYRMEAARKGRRTYNPSLATVIKLANVAGVTLDDFTGTRLNFIQ